MLDLWWDKEGARHIQRRSERYPGATDIEPSWTVETAADPDASSMIATRTADPGRSA